jgi:AraC-like DNA-binding protein
MPRPPPAWAVTTWPDPLRLKDIGRPSEDSARGGPKLEDMAGRVLGVVRQRSEEAHLWRTDDFGGLELLRASYVDFVFTPHSHEDFLIALTEKGVGYPVFRRDSHAVGPGDVFVLNPEESHAGGPATYAPWGYRALYPSMGLLRRIAAEFDGSVDVVPEFSTDVLRDRTVTSALRRFHQISENPASSKLHRESVLASALVALVERHGRARAALRRRGKEHRGVKAAREYLDEHAPENISLASLASLVGLSPFHFCRVFRDVVGLTPHAYQTQIRVRRAKQLLGQNVPIAEAAVEAGFYDQAHLTKHFKRVVGITPGRYLAAHHGVA